MPDQKKPQTIELSRLKPTQLTVGKLLVKRKRMRLKEFEKKPVELVDFILEHPVRVVLGPLNNVYVIDHHHLALALIKEDFETAPVQIDGDFSTLTLKAFWKKMETKQFVHPIDDTGKRKSIATLPKNLRHLEDDPYRSLAGFVREAGGFIKVSEPFAEFQWADYYRARIDEKTLNKDFDEALKEAMKLASHSDARNLPGYKGRKKA